MSRIPIKTAAQTDLLDTKLASFFLGILFTLFAISAIARLAAHHWFWAAFDAGLATLCAIDAVRARSTNTRVGRTADGTALTDLHHRNDKPRKTGG